tara:strand:+ start:883 stop:1122 length:240 start_codon:yes stop_codon:yes gene_type:complete
MNDFELREMKHQLDRLDELMKLLVAKECNCLSCLLKGCDCCANKGNVDDLIEKYHATRSALKHEEDWREGEKKRIESEE